jgi:hypothetical protein
MKAPKHALDPPGAPVLHQLVASLIGTRSDLNDEEKKEQSIYS